MEISCSGLILVGAQKNMGIVSLTFVIVREDLIQERPEILSMLSYAM